MDAEDLTAWGIGFGAQTDVTPIDGDADLDADVDGADFLVWQEDYRAAAATATVQRVPEPAATITLLLGLVFLFCMRR